MNPLDENNNLRYLGSDRLTHVEVYEDKTTLERYIEFKGKLYPIKKYNEALLSNVGNSSEVFKSLIDLDEYDENEEPLSDKEIKESIKQYQSTCKHNAGYVTNTIGPSKCVMCGKPWI